MRGGGTVEPGWSREDGETWSDWRYIFRSSSTIGIWLMGCVEFAARRRISNGSQVFSLSTWVNNGAVY